MIKVSRKPVGILLVGLLLFLAACAQQPTAETLPMQFETPLPNAVAVHQDEAGEDGHSHEHVAESEATTAMRVVLVPSELVVGPDRFAVGLLNADGDMIHEADVHFHYYDLSNADSPVLEMEADATRLQTPDGYVTAFAHERTFDRAGQWGVQVQAHFPDGATAVQAVRFEVLAESATLEVGETAPALDTPTLADVEGDLARLTSAPAPTGAFYQHSLAEALSSGRPTVLLFATPAFCQTRFCGPDYEIAGQLQARYGDRVNFLHVEVYSGLPDPSVNDWALAPAMTAFGLHTEPWLYVIDATGVVAYRVEGLFTAEEVEAHLEPLL